MFGWEIFTREGVFVKTVWTSREASEERGFGFIPKVRFFK